MPAQWKVKEVEELAELLGEYSVVGIANIFEIPAWHMQRIRTEMKEIARIRIAKKTLIRKAIEKLGRKDLEKLLPYLENGFQPALVLSNANPFEIHKKLNELKINIPAKPGRVAKNNIVLKKGETPFRPGPILVQLEKLGVPVQVIGGKIHITKDHVLVKAGDIITDQLAELLSQLGVEPIEVKLDLVVVCDRGMIVPKDLLNYAIDTEARKRELIKAHENALKLAIKARIFTKETIEFLLREAYENAKKLAINACIIDKETIKDILRVAYARACKLKEMVRDSQG